MLMKKIFYLYSKSLLSKLALIAILILGGGNSAWADTVYFDSENSSTISGWTAQSHSQRTWGSPYYIYKNGTGATLTSDAAIDFSAQNKLVINSKYYNSTGCQIVVKYSSDNGNSWTTHSTITDIPSTNKDFEISDLVGSYRIQLEFDNVYIYKLSLIETNPYTTPTDFILDSFTENTATFSWTAGNSETAWQFDYSTNAAFTPGEGINGTSVSITDNPYTLTGLTTGTTYYAAIRADYGSGNYSDWTDKVEFIPRAESEITINDGTNTNSNVPFSGNACNGITNSQFIIPSSSLSAVANRQITKLTFYSNNASRSWSTAEFEVYMKETSNTTYGSAAYDSWGTCVLNSATLSVADNLLTIELNTPFNYQGGNLQIGFKISKTGSSSYNSFYGVTGSTYTAVYGTGTSSETKYRAQFLPKMTITSVPITTDPVQMGLNGYTTFASPRALDLANLPSGLKAYKASTIDGTWVKFSEINDVVVANTGILLEGNASETYNIPVATTSGNDISDSNLFFVNSTGGTFTAESGYTYYGMIKATSAADPIVFGTFAPGSVAIPTNRAYLKVANSGGTSRLTCVFDNGETTGVQTVNAEPLTVNQYFDLQGRRVAQPTRGLYIINGKKVVIK